MSKKRVTFAENPIEPVNVLWSSQQKKLPSTETVGRAQTTDRRTNGRNNVSDGGDDAFLGEIYGSFSRQESKNRSSNARKSMCPPLNKQNHDASSQRDKMAAREKAQQVAVRGSGALSKVPAKGLSNRKQEIHEVRQFHQVEEQRRTIGIDVETFDKLSMQSPFFKQLADNQMRMMEKQNGLEKMMHDILMELRSNKPTSMIAQNDAQSDRLERSLVAVGGELKRSRDEVTGLPNMANAFDDKNCAKRSRSSDAESETAVKNVSNDSADAQISFDAEISLQTDLNSTDAAEQSDGMLEQSDGEYDDGEEEPEPIGPNTDKSLHMQNPDFKICIFCNKRFAYIVSHYKNAHSEHELRLSRLSQEMANLILHKNQQCVVKSRGNNRRVEAKCYFCASNKNFTLPYWTDHIRNHTGEYSNRCRVCNMTFPYATNHCDAKTTKIGDYLSYDCDVVGFLCLECNFFQIDEDNITRHLSAEHQFDDAVLADKYKQVTFISLIPNNRLSGNALRPLQSPGKQSDTDHVDASNGFHGWDDDAGIEMGTQNLIENVENQGWQIVKTLKNDPTERENLLAMEGHYTKNVFYDFQVKVWIDDYWTKTALGMVSQFALFKCMHSHCIFATHNVNDAAIHMDSHLTFIDVLKCKYGNLAKAIRDEQIKFRDCPYCDLEADYNNELLTHIMEEHSQSIFQCSYCFYRTVEVDNMVLHHETHHSDEKPEVLLCGEGREFGQQDYEILRDECEKNVDKILCGQDECQTEFLTFKDLYSHLDAEHPDNTDFKCVYCNETKPMSEIERHLNHHQFWEFQCIHCKFGSNDITDMRHHLASKHPSKYSFIASRRKIPNLKSIFESIDITVLYVGGMADHRSYTFYKMHGDTNMTVMAPSLSAYNAHRVQQVMPVKRAEWKDELPEITFSTAITDFYIDFMDYNPFKCVFKCDDGTACTFARAKEVDIWRHCESHAKKPLHYKSVEVSSESMRVVKSVKAMFECNSCGKQYETRRAIDSHFAHSHKKCIVDAKIVQTIEVLESTDPNQPEHSTEVVSSPSFYSGLYFCAKDDFYANNKNDLIKHHRTTHLPTEQLEMKIKQTFHSARNSSTLTQENQLFDRMLVYECYHCAIASSKIQRVFESIGELDAHREQEHEPQPLLYIAKKLVSCVACKIVNTIDGIKLHYGIKHPDLAIAMANITNRNQCGVCSNRFSMQKDLEMHFAKEHSEAGSNECFRDRMLDNLGATRTLDGVEFSPDCCRRFRSASISKVVDHVIYCPKSEFGSIKSYDMAGFLNLFADMEVFLHTGLVLTFKCINKTTVGEEICNNLCKEFNNKVWTRKF